MVFSKTSMEGNRCKKVKKTYLRELLLLLAKKKQWLFNIILHKIMELCIISLILGIFITILKENFLFPKNKSTFLRLKFIHYSILWVSLGVFSYVLLYTYRGCNTIWSLRSLLLLWSSINYVRSSSLYIM